MSPVLAAWTSAISLSSVASTPGTDTVFSVAGISERAHLSRETFFKDPVITWVHGYYIGTAGK